ncbi:hypothetical protein SAMN06265365_10991 [Tistlia consotensis]|uniref:Glycoamylase-like domain-containing protein n=1 Tax=Tistlia consotensis USBA 355 TaxID=560819 RepID=A0A1Y6CDW5_9PROT|nr:glucoamylase family protein [Tistlia consotensis]SMF58690.1 hypothetical protein SAMN05428998_12242 [Tistlia consotensis USBA 355]SNR63638.1 hypothetical protein SAMN06265365_10991 [Tistlia consotensis]
MSDALSAPDRDLLDELQRRTFGYFRDFAHPVSALARDRAKSDDDAGDDFCALGGSGFGAMVLVVGVERGWITRAEAVERLLTMTGFLLKAARFHGVLPHFLDGKAGTPIPLSPQDDAADLVEQALLLQGLLTARQYFDGDAAGERELRERIGRLWRETDWAWHTKGGEPVLYWHWSPTFGWAMNHPIRGWNECLIAYVLAAASPDHGIDPAVYHQGWTGGPEFRNGRRYHGIELPLGPEGGGPLFFAHYSFLGLDPRGLRDRYADYWAQNVAHVRVNEAHCRANPHGFAGYGADCWGLTASDDDQGYAAHDPAHDRGVISPTAALASLPYWPEASLRALRHFRHDLGGRIWGRYGFVDAFNLSAGWYATTYLAIDQGPIVCMIENHRSGLLWRLFMSCPEIQRGLRRLGFESPALA